MKPDSRSFLKTILKELRDIDYIDPKDLPNIDLYMDQVTTFMEQKLDGTRRYPDDKVLTKTMINNYAKNHLLPPPDKKRYSRDHLLLLIFIYYFKNILSIADVDKLLTPLIRDYYPSNEHPELSLETIYDEIVKLEMSETKPFVKDIINKFHIAEEMFNDIDASEDEIEYLHHYTFICMLSFDVYVKKMMIEKLIDLLPDPDESQKSRKANSKAAAKRTANKKRS